MLGLYQGVPGARHWRRHLSEFGPRSSAGIEVIQQAMENMKRAGKKGRSMDASYQRHG
jgi:tRNA-dihydrouridine synthase A